MVAGHLFIRADATSDTGAGHVMRCLSLGQAWQKREGKVFFIGDCPAASLRQRFQEEGFSFLPLAAPHPDQGDLSTTIKFIESNCSASGIDWVILDGYHFDGAYHRQIRSTGVRLLVVDDYHHLPEYNVDAILNPNMYGPNIQYMCSAGTILLLGGGFSLLRAEFKQWDRWWREIPEKVSGVCVMLGGADKENVTAMVLRALAMLPRHDFSVRVVVGPANPHFDFLQKATRFLPFPVDLLLDVKDMPALMAWSDLAVSAAGGTCLELACMGVPTLTIITADNQEIAAATFAKAGIFDTLGWWNAFSETQLAERIWELMNDQNTRREISKKGRNLIASSGADNSVEVLLANFFIVDA